MKSFEHAAVGAVAGVAVAIAVDPPGNLPLLVAGAAFVSVFADPDHFVIAYVQRGDWANLRLTVANPQVGLLDQERVFEEFDTGFDHEHLLSHHLVGGVAVGALALSGLGSLAAFLAVVLYVHVVCDFLRDLGIA